jgi:hypothetical protein
MSSRSAPPFPVYMRNDNMSDRYASLILYHLSDDDLSHVLLRCSDLMTFICQTLYPGSDVAGHVADPRLAHAEVPPTLLWWLSSLRGFT